MRGVGAPDSRSHDDDAESNRMVLVGLVHAWWDPKRLLLAVLDMDDSSSTLRFASAANSRLRRIRDHCFGRADMVGVKPQALAHGEDSSNFRVVHQPTDWNGRVPTGPRSSRYVQM